MNEAPKIQPTKSPKEASVPIRLIAAFIDWISVFSFGIFGGVFCGVLAVGAAQLPPDATPEVVAQAAGGAIGFGVWTWMLAFAVMNFVILESATGSSLGKKIFGLKLYFWDETGKAPTFPSMGQALSRLALSVFAGIPISVNHQGTRKVRFWHDVMSRTWLLKGTWPQEAPQVDQDNNQDQFKSAA